MAKYDPIAKIGNLPSMWEKEKQQPKGSLLRLFRWATAHVLWEDLAKHYESDALASSLLVKRCVDDYFRTFGGDAGFDLDEKWRGHTLREHLNTALLPLLELCKIVFTESKGDLNRWALLQLAVSNYFALASMLGQGRGKSIKEVEA